MDRFPEEGSTRSAMAIYWPHEYRPENSSVHVSNELFMPQLRLETVWQWMCRADLWPAWYPNSANVQVKHQLYPDLRLGTEFRWKTFGVTLDSTVREFVPHERLAWDAHCNGVHAYHAWVFEAREGGVYALTEETQNGWLAWLGAQIMPDRMHRGHQLWLIGLSKVAEREVG